MILLPINRITHSGLQQFWTPRLFFGQFPLNRGLPGLAAQRRQKTKPVHSGWARFIPRGISRLVGAGSRLKTGDGGKASDTCRQKSEKSTIRRVIGLAGLAQIQSPVTVIFIHYHPDEYVAPGFAKLVQSAVESGFRAVFVSTSRPSRALPQLGECPSLAYIHRDNHGYDFGALKDARDILVRHGLLGDGRYVVLNSSMLNLASAGFGKDWVLDKLSAPGEKADLLGVTASYEYDGYHIQTYFYSLSSDWFCSRECKSFLDKYNRGLAKTKLSPRNYAIKAGELSLSRVATKAGYDVRSIFEDLLLPNKECYEQAESLTDAVRKLIPRLDLYDLASAGPLTSNPANFKNELLPKLGMQTNLSHSFWALLLFRQFLFLKRELLELKDPAAVHAPSVVALLIPVLEACEVRIPEWSDIHALPRLLHASKVRQHGNTNKKSVK